MGVSARAPRTAPPVLPMTFATSPVPAMRLPAKRRPASGTWRSARSSAERSWMPDLAMRRVRSSRPASPRWAPLRAAVSARAARPSQARNLRATQRQVGERVCGHIAGEPEPTVQPVVARVEQVTRAIARILDVLQPVLAREAVTCHGVAQLPAVLTTALRPVSSTWSGTSACLTIGLPRTAPRMPLGRDCFSAFFWWTFASSG